jgi:replicative DNA helicase Mcm
MTQQDTSALHEAMESQKISFAKAGITATLQCRCSMLAAANPKRGRFDDGDIGDQINLPPALMSRFDMIFTIKDRPSPANDKRITDHILNVHRRGQVIKSERSGIGEVDEKILNETGAIEPVYKVEFLRKYVAYSKRIVPVMSDDALGEIRETYLKIRATGGGKSRSVPITARYLEACIRLSEASARARLSNTVTVDDSRRSIRIMHYFLDKVLGSGSGDEKTVWDADRIATGMPANVRDGMQTVRDTIKEYVLERGMGISKGELIGMLSGQISEMELSKILGKMTTSGEVYSPSFDVYKLTDE